MKDITLLNLCESFFKKAIDVLLQYINTKGYIPKRTFYEPVAEFDEKGNLRTISYVPYDDEDFVHLVFKCHQLLELLPETRNACNYISDKKYLLIGGANYAPYILLDHALIRFFQKTRTIDYLEHVFMDIYLEIENVIFGKELTFRSTAKLENFSSTLGHIKFDDMHSIKKYSQDECKELYRHPSINIYDYTLPHPGDFRIEVIETKDKDTWTKTGSAGAEDIKRILTTLRLFKDSAVGIGSLETNEPITWFPFTGKSGQLLPPHTVGDICSIEEDEIQLLSNVWKVISNINYKNCPPLKIAMKRFNYAHEHKRREDSLIDIMIGLEALFTKEEGELTFRLALRVSTFLEALLPHYRTQRKTLFDNMKKAYGLRSRVVHGSEVSEPKIWECRMVKTYLSDSIGMYAQLSRSHTYRQILTKIDESIKSASDEDLKTLCLDERKPGDARTS